MSGLGRGYGSFGMIKIRERKRFVWEMLQEVMQGILFHLSFIRAIFDTDIQ